MIAAALPSVVLNEAHPRAHPTRQTMAAPSAKTSGSPQSRMVCVNAKTQTVAINPNTTSTKPVIARARFFMTGFSRLFTRKDNPDIGGQANENLH